MSTFGTEQILEVLGTLEELLSRHPRRWYLFGAQAASIWGRPRMTADIDITIELPSADVPSFIETMEQSGFALRISTGVEDFISRTRVLPFVHTKSNLPLDVVLAGPGLEDQFLARAQSRTISGFEIPIISPEDLIITKILAQRAKDLEDVRGILLRRKGKLDLAIIRRTLKLLEEALGQSDLLPTFEKLQRAIQQHDSS